MACFQVIKKAVLCVRGLHYFVRGIEQVGKSGNRAVCVEVDDNAAEVEDEGLVAWIGRTSHPANIGSYAENTKGRW